MSQAMRERLIAAARRTGFVERGSYEVNNWPQVVDAILAELREPDAAMLIPVRVVIHREAHIGPGSPEGSREYDVDGLVDIAAVFTAMIDAVRAGR